MTHRLTTDCAKNYCNRTLIVEVIVENVVTCFFWDTVYISIWPGVMSVMIHTSVYYISTFATFFKVNRCYSSYYDISYTIHDIQYNISEMVQRRDIVTMDN